MRIMMMIIIVVIVIVSVSVIVIGIAIVIVIAIDLQAVAALPHLPHLLEVGPSSIASASVCRTKLPRTQRIIAVRPY